jgi:AcrR family transcriptional regulator
MVETDPEDADLPRGIALAWGVAANPQRGPKREMSVESIVDAAVELADAEGLGAVSMAAVAARLGYTPMSLYRYVTAKDDLILLMQEEATGLPPEHVG